MNNATVKTSSNTTTQATAQQATTPSFDTSFVKLCERYTLQLARTRCEQGALLGAAIAKAEG